MAIGISAISSKLYMHPQRLELLQVTLVVNFDVPTERDSRKPAFETYLHRIGRSGRFGRRGAAFNLVATAQVQSHLILIAGVDEFSIDEVVESAMDQHPFVLAWRRVFWGYHKDFAQALGPATLLFPHESSPIGAEPPYLLFSQVLVIAHTFDWS